RALAHVDRHRSLALGQVARVGHVDRDCDIRLNRKGRRTRAAQADLFLRGEYKIQVVFGLGFRSCSIASSRVTQPMRLSRYGPQSTPFCSKRGASNTAKSPICTYCSASALSFAPISINKLSIVRSL